jgi:hypothetical protein
VKGKFWCHYNIDCACEMKKIMRGEKEEKEEEGRGKRKGK